MNKHKIAGLSLNGGRKDNFYFCLFEFFPDSQRWFLSSLLALKEEENHSGDDVIRKWIHDYEINHLIVNTPLTSVHCDSCQLVCPGATVCEDEVVREVRGKIEEILEQDKKLHAENPKKYEQDRVKNLEYDHHKDFYGKDSEGYLLSKSFKRRLKKGYLPYWNRPLDVWIWCRYHDLLLSHFSTSFDSFGNTSLMLKHKFSYLKRHFPAHMEIYESHTLIALIELVRAGILKKKQLDDLKDFEKSAVARLALVRSIEKELDLFIYENDLEVLGQKQEAFESFILGISGQRVLLDRLKKMPPWARGQESKYIVPDFRN